MFDHRHTTHMRRGPVRVVLSLWLATACGPDGGTGPEPAPSPTWTAAELSLLRDLAIDRLPALAPDPSNHVADEPRAAALGQRLFLDPRLSVNGEVSCATCHLPTQQFQDGRPVAQGIGLTTRRTMPIMGTAYSRWQFWDGRRDSQWSQALAPLESAVEHGAARLGLVRVVADHYAAEYEALFGALPDLAGLPPTAGPVADPSAATAWAAIPADRQHAINRAFANLGKVIAAFERTVGYGPSRFDHHLLAMTSGQPIPDSARLSVDEIAGAALFVGKGQCVRCHTGPLLTDQQFHNAGTPAL